MGYIYKITNDINNKIYIGKTEHINPEDRWKEHLNDYKKERCEKRPLYAAMNKYRVEHFHFEVIEETQNDEISCEREQYWIEKLRTYVGFKDCNGYNATLGGDGKSYLNLDEDEVIRYHIEEACYVTKWTAEHFNLSYDTIKEVLTKNNIVYLRQQDVNKMISYIKYGGVLQIDIKTKNIINSFETAQQADEYFCYHSDKIGKICRSQNIIKHYIGGYFFCYGVDYLKYIDKINENDINYKKQNKKQKEKKKNKRYNYELIYSDLLNTKNLVKTIDNLQLNIKSISNIRRMLKKLGYDMSFLKQKKEIIQIDIVTNKIINKFDSITDANIALNKNPYSRNISSCLSGKTKTAYGYIWKYI